MVCSFEVEMLEENIDINCMYQCRRCGKQLGDQQHIFSMSKEGPQGAFVNPGGHVHETLTLHKAKNLRLVGEPSTQYSWFPGYAWTIVECSGCW